MKRIKKQFVAFVSVAWIGLHSFAQTDGLSILRSEFTTFSERFPTEEIYVHTDKNFYTAGEIVWFKIYHLKPSGLSKVAYVEILDADNVAVTKAKISIDTSGSGSLLLPLTLTSGYYTFRCYTNWMKNYGVENFFHKQITIVNPLKNLAAKDENVFSGSMDLFPEGGNLVNQIASTVAFKILDRNGKGATGRGYLMNERNDTVLTFAPFKFGLGSFNFTPDVSHNYKATFVFDDNSIIAKPLPQIYAQGYVMHVEEEQKNVKVLIQSNVLSGYPEVFLVVQNHGTLKAAKRNVLSNGTAVFVLDKSELGRGVSQVTAFDNEKRPVCERLFFIAPSPQASLHTTVDKPGYGNREQVVLSASATLAGSAKLSVSVYQLDSLQTRDPSDIFSYMWLESELNGRIEDPQYYLSGNTEEKRRAANYLMLTHGWRRFDWNQILNGKPAITFLPEISGQLIACKVLDQNNKPVKDVEVFLSIPETTYKLYSGISNDSGLVRITVKDFFGSGELILQTDDPTANYKLTVLSPYADQYRTSKYPLFSIASTQKSLLEEHSIDMQAQHIYMSDSIQQFFAPFIRDTFPFFGKPLYSYRLDNYTRFTTMEEVLREYVREINVGVKGSGELKFKLFNEDSRDFFVDNILVTVDGVPEFNTSKIYSLDPLKFRSLDIITKNYVLGSSIFHGVASFSTYKGNYEGIEIDPKAVTIDYEGLQLQRQFYSPNYATEQQRQSRIPDFRTTLFWSPDIRLNQKVQFFTGDNKGKYLIVVQGVSSNGEPLSAVSEFEVK
jgi:hypothetical protein